MFLHPSPRLERESLIWNPELSIPKNDHIVNGKNGVVKRIFWGSPIKIFDKVRRFYFGDFRKDYLGGSLVESEPYLLNELDCVSWGARIVEWCDLTLWCLRKPALRLVNPHPRWPVRGNATLDVWRHAATGGSFGKQFGVLLFNLSFTALSF